MKKRLLTLLFACLASSLTSQEQEQHEFTFGVYSGLSSLSTLSSALKSGVGVVLGYNWFFSNTMGISTGVEYSYLRCRSSIEELSDRYNSHDAANVPFEFRYTLKGFIANIRICRQSRQQPDKILINSRINRIFFYFCQRGKT
jgi:hypothetical protein